MKEKTLEALGEASAAYSVREWVTLDADGLVLPFEAVAQTRRYPVGDEAFQERVLKDVLQTKNLGVWELDAAESKAPHACACLRARNIAALEAQLVAGLCASTARKP